MRTRLVVAIAILVVGVTVGAAVFGPDILSGGPDDGSNGDSFPTQTTTQSGGGADDGGSGGSIGNGTGGGTVDATDPFGVDIVAVRQCGETCRDVTIELTNQQQTQAEDVTVYSRIFADKGTDGEVVWTGTESVGTLEGGESVTRTKRVSLSFSEAFAVQQADGWITIQTTVESGDETMTFTEQRDVIA